ncbi:MAG TPA: sigma-70 family RNA polymerase sigma factor [Nocardioides sp.]|nr:sigma-70 family RNA polymerase sigma factor [Nocardioides sp.]
MSVSLPVEGPGDAELISAVRGGDIDAYGELFARHVDSARRLARQLAGPADADDLVSDAFTKVLTVLQRGGGPDLAFRAYLLTAVRRLHVDKIRAGSRLRPVDDLTPFDPGLPFHDTAVAGFENAAAARAFASLPERWQMVLWHIEVEQQKPADIAPLLGMSANSVSALAYRAREGLRQAFLSQHATDPDDVDCAWTRDHLGAYVRSGLSRRDASRVDDHLASCRACAAVYLELTEVNSGLAGILAPLLLGSAGAGYVSSGGAGSGFLSTGFSAARTWAVSHASVTAIGGIIVTATAVLSIYGATHFHSQDAADVGSPPVLSPTPAASGLPTNGGDGKQGHHDARSRAPDAGKTTVPPPTSEAPSVTPTSAPPSTGPTDTTTGPTEQSTGPTGPTTGPTDPTTGPTDPGADQITFTSTPPVDPTFGSTYEVSATSGSGQKVTFSVAPTINSLGPACTISGSTVTFRHAGTCVIAAEVTSRTGAGAAAKDDTQSIDVPQEAQKVALTTTAPSSPAFGDTYQVFASSTGSPVVLAVDTTTNSLGPACTISGTDPGSTVTFEHAGTCTVTATAGNDDYLPATDTQTVGVPQEQQKVTITTTAPSSPAFGDTYQVFASSTGSPVVLSVDTTTNSLGPACTISGTDPGSTVTFEHAGTCTVTATADNDDYLAAGDTQAVGVPQEAQRVTITSSAPTSPTFGSTYPVNATSDSGAPVTFSVDPKTSNSACVVNDPDLTDSTAKVTIDHAGTCIIDADQPGNDDYSPAATAQQSVLVARLAQKVSFTTTPPTNPALRSTYTVGATSDSGGPISFSVDPQTTNSACVVTDNDPTDTRATVTFNHVGTCLLDAAQDGTTRDGYTDYQPASTAKPQRIDVPTSLSLDAIVDPNRTIGDFFGWRHVIVTVDGLTTGETAKVSATAPNQADVVAFGARCIDWSGMCPVTSTPVVFDYYVRSNGAVDVTFTVTSNQSPQRTASKTVTVVPW